MAKQDLPDLSEETKIGTLHGLAKAGLTFADCVKFFSSQQPEDDLYFVKGAKNKYSDEGHIEVDDNAMVSRGVEGAYVMAWVWVYDDETGED